MNLFTVRSLALLTSFLLLGFYGHSQNEDRHEEIESFKIAFLTKRLALTPEEAKEFWPVYNKFNDELKAVRMMKRKEQQEATVNFLSMSSEEFNSYNDNQVKLMEAETQVIVKYHQQFKKVLPPQKLALFYKAKEDFTRNLLKRMRDNSRLSNQ